MSAPGSLVGARLVAWAGFAFGALVSISGNILQAWIPPQGAEAGWTPSVWAQVFAGVWPIALLIAVEVLSRTAWPLLMQAPWWQRALGRLLSYGSVGGVALFAATISYQHIRDVLLNWHYPELSAGVGPLVIDGLMVVSGYAMVVGSAGVMATRELEQREQPPAVVREKVAEVFEIPMQVLGEPPVPRPREEAPAHNGRKVTAALRTTTQPRKATGKTNDEIVAELREEIRRAQDGNHDGPDLTKRGLMERYSIGAGRYAQITAALKEEA